MKTIVFCADGTWNGPGESADDPKDACATNVFKLYLALAGKDVLDTATYRSANEQERRLTEDGRQLQVAKYLHGVGDSDNFLVKLLGGSLGAGVITRVVRGYTFVSRHYEPGDRIVLLGFSRGAYTARALAGLIAGKGVLDARKHDLEDKQNAYRLGSAVWNAYRTAACRAAERPTWAQRLEALAGDWPSFFTRPPETPQCIADTPIEAVGVWDTVGALGIPEYQVDMCRLDAFQFCDTRLSPKVRAGFHAVAIDEARADFTPTLWSPDERIAQVLFAGAHADVGGGYTTQNAESGLSDIALQWMVDRLGPCGVRFDALPTPFAPSPTGVAHQPWRHSPWKVLPRIVRDVKGLTAHPSVAERMQAAAVCGEPGDAAAAYRPAGLQ